MSRRVTVLLLAGTLLLAGCPHDEYTLVLRPRGTQLDRTLTVRGVEGDDVSGARLAALARLYGLDQPPAEGEGPFEFHGVFDGNLPDDVGGGAGRFLGYPTGAGAVNVYVESFRGSDDLYAQVRAQRQAVELAVDLARGWLKQEVGHLAGFDKLDRFCRTRLADDLMSLSLYEWNFTNISSTTLTLHPDLDAWLAGAITGDANAPQPAAGAATDANAVASKAWKDVLEPQLGQAVLARAGLFLARRGYLSHRDVPGLVQAVSGSDANLADLEPWLRGVLVRQAHLGEHRELVKALTGLLSHAERAKESMESYLRTTDLYAQAAREAGYNNPHDADGNFAVSEAAAKKLQTRLYPLFHVVESMMSTGDDLKVVLHTGAEPMFTNGLWRAREKTVRWAGPIRGLPEDANLPVCAVPSVCYALWVRPDTDAQTRQFGRVVLDGNELAEYALAVWRLAPADRKLWEQFYAGLKADNWEARAEAFLKEHPELKESPALLRRLEPVAELLERKLSPATTQPAVQPEEDF